MNDAPSTLEAFLASLPESQTTFISGSAPDFVAMTWDAQLHQCDEDPVAHDMLFHRELEEFLNLEKSNHDNSDDVCGGAPAELDTIVLFMIVLLSSITPIRLCMHVRELVIISSVNQYLWHSLTESRRMQTATPTCTHQANSEMGKLAINPLTDIDGTAPCSVVRCTACQMELLPHDLLVVHCRLDGHQLHCTCALIPQVLNSYWHTRCLDCSTCMATEDEDLADIFFGERA